MMAAAGCKVDTGERGGSIIRNPLLTQFDCCLHEPLWKGIHTNYLTCGQVNQSVLSAGWWMERASSAHVSPRLHASYHLAPVNQTLSSLEAIYFCALWVKSMKGSGFTAWSPHADLLGKGDKLCTGEPSGGGGHPGRRRRSWLSTAILIGNTLDLAVDWGIHHPSLCLATVNGRSPRQQTRRSRWRRCWCCPSGKRPPAPRPQPICLQWCKARTWEQEQEFLSWSAVVSVKGRTWAAAVGGRLRDAQDALKLFLEAVGPLQQGLQPVDKLCTDDVLRAQWGGRKKVSY